MARKGAPTALLAEQRGAPRVETTLSATLTAGKRRVSFRVDDLSTSGARLSGEMPLVLDQRIKMELVIDDESIEVEAEVVRVQSADLLTDQAAVRFLDVPATTHDALEHYVARALTDEPVDVDEEQPTIRLSKIELAPREHTTRLMPKRR